MKKVIFISLLVLSLVSIALSKLRTAGWLEITKLDPKDSRKRYYKLNKLEEIFQDMAKLS